MKVLKASVWCWMDIDFEKTVKIYDDNFNFVGWCLYNQHIILGCK